MADLGSRIGTLLRTLSHDSATRPVATVGGAAVAMVTALMLFSHSTAVESALASAVADPAAILAARSPGARAPGALTQTKLAYTRKAPIDRVLGQERARPVLPTTTTPGSVAAPLGAALPVAPAAAFSDPVAAAPDPFVSSPGLVPVSGVPVSGLVPGGPVDGDPVTPPVDPVTPPVSAIPEPSTWMMTILGFFAAGLGLRRRRQVARAALAVD